MEIDEFGAIWIAKKNSDVRPAVDLSNRMKKIDLAFEEIDPDSAVQKCGTTLITDKNESYYYEPTAFSSIEVFFAQHFTKQLIAVG